MRNELQRKLSGTAGQECTDVTSHEEKGESPKTLQ